jgi:TonB family protein
MFKLSNSSPFEKSFLVSLLLHGTFWGFFSWRGPGNFINRSTDSLEIDLTRPFRLTSDPLLARRAKNVGGDAPRVMHPTTDRGGGIPDPLPKPMEIVSGPSSMAPAPEWVLPGPTTTELEKLPIEEAGTTALPVGEGQGAGLGGLGGTGDGEVDWIYLTDLPRILNRDQLNRDLRRFYPEAERRAGHEADVLLDVHIGQDGQVRAVNIITTGGVAFDAAARQVLGRARFSPARVGTKPVSVKIRQTIAFRLE